MPDDPLDQPVDRATIESLHAAGHLSAGARRAALSWLRPPLRWWLWASRMLLFLGAALVLAGVVFFFAYNWARMGKALKFGVVEAGLVGCLVAAWIAGLDRIAGKLLVLAACVLVGVLLAVYGQVYQTGADPYELFVGWALLILGWVVVARFGALWVMWLAVVNTAVILYWGQVAEPNELASWEAMFVVLAVVNALALVGREAGLRVGWEWLAGRWLRWVVLASVLTWLTILPIRVIVEPDEINLASGSGVVLWLAAIAAGHGYYRLRSRDLLALTLTAASMCAVVLTLIGKWLFEVSDEAPVLLLFGLIILGVVTAAALWLHRVGRSFEEKADAE